jgi:NAD(P)-dependent dehydrogenase (short-subunit alcohol dehydrogenase family)
MRTAVVIGNSDGIGFALTERLLAEGFRVVGLSRRASRLAAKSYEHHVVDVRSAEYPAKLEEVVSSLGGVDVFVYCAGIGDFLDIETLASDEQVFETNLMGAVVAARVLIPSMVRAGRGHFIGLSSQGDSLVSSTAPSYAASKAALSSYLEGLALACRPRGVYVTNVRLGFVDTKMAKSPQRPFMISRSRAAERVWRCIQKRPMRDTYPKRMAALLWFVSLAVRLRQWVS